jgi:hypothetical protein
MNAEQSKRHGGTKARRHKGLSTGVPAIPNPLPSSHAFASPRSVPSCLCASVPSPQ